MFSGGDNGLVASNGYENGISADYGFDVMDRVTNIVWTDSTGTNVLNSFAYSYNAAGMISQKVTQVTFGDPPVAETREIFAYNDLDMLTSETKLDSTNGVIYEKTYQYDLAGNRSNTVINGVTNVYTLGTGNKLSSWGTNGTMSYADAGNVTNITYQDGRSLGIAWNDRYEITSISTNGALAESYEYDALGRRVSISDGTTTNYLVYDGVQVIAEVGTNSLLVRSYTYGPGVDNVLAMSVYTNSGGTTSVASVFFFVKDHLGSVQALTDTNGVVVESYEYDAWGNVLGVYDSTGGVLQASAIGNRILWQGREYSWKTGLYNFRARWYDPITGRWLSKDPIGISGGLNQYVFCDNNPGNFRDSFGLCSDDSWTENTWVGVFGESDGALFVGRHGGGGVLLNVADTSKTAAFTISGWKFGGGGGGSVGAHIIVIVNAPENIKGFVSKSGGADWDFSLAGKWDSAVKSAKGVGAAYKLIKAHKKIRYVTESILRNRGVLGAEETKVITMPVPLAGGGISIWGGYKTTTIEVQ